MKTKSIVILGLLMLACASPQKISNNKFEEKLKTESTPEGSHRSKQSIWKAIEPKTYEIQQIYQSYNPAQEIQAEGKVLIRFEIDANGYVIQESVVETDIQDTAFTNKVKEIVHSTRFEDISKEHEYDVTEIVFPFIFKNKYEK